MFRWGLAILLYYLALSAGVGSHPLLLTNESSDASSSSIASRNPVYEGLNLLSAYKNAKTLNKFLTKAGVASFHTQGENSRMYEIWKGRWPCPACKPQELKAIYPALAKMHVQQPKYTSESYLSSIAEERHGLGLVGQLLDYGKDDYGSNWTIVRDMRVTPPGHSRDLIKNIVSTKQHMTFSHCRTLYHQAHGPVLKRMQWYVENKQILHRDVNAYNVLLDMTLSDVELVDWGYWIGRKRWEPEVDPATINSIAHMRKQFIDASPIHCDGYPMP